MRSRVPGASVRDPAKADGLASSRVRVRRGDFAEPDTLLQAFEGATQVLLASSNARAADGDTLAQHRAAIPAAVGARRIVYTSQAAASATSEFPPMWDHATTEEVLRGSGLRMDGAAERVLRVERASVHGGGAAGRARRLDGACRPRAGRRGRSGRRGGFDGPTPPLTGPQALDLAGLAALASEVVGRPIAREVIADDATRARLRGPDARATAGRAPASMGEPIADGIGR
jgi:uncharacterized protein YbjT (DUF2867 family)